MRAQMKRNILLGMPTLIELGDMDKNIDFCRSLNLDLLELNMNLPYLQVGDLRKIDFPDDLKFSIHLPEEFNAWDFNPKVREAYLQTIIETMELARVNNIKVLNMHMNTGVYFTLPDRKVFLFEENKDFYQEKTREFRSLAEKHLKGSDAKIYLENTGILDIPFIQDAVSCLLACDCFALTWDIGHDASSGYRDSAFYKANIAKVNHLHVHDAVGPSNHLPLGEGEIDLDDIFSAAGGYADSIILETKTCEGLKKSADYFRKKYC